MADLKKTKKGLALSDGLILLVSNLWPYRHGLRQCVSVQNEDPQETMI